MVGEVFHEGAVAELTRDPATDSCPSTWLARRGADSCRPSVFSGERTFRFRHILIRDAAYESIPKEDACRHARALRAMARGEQETGRSSTRRSSATTSSRRITDIVELGPVDDAMRGRLDRAAASGSETPAAVPSGEATDPQE